jgi:hypothetical protein
MNASSFMKGLSRGIVALTASMLVALPARAQSSADTRSGVPRQNLVSSNPIGVLFEWYNGEYERAVSGTASFAVAATSYDFDSERYSSIDGIARYYPAGRALRGFSIGMSVGFVDISDSDDDCNLCEDESGTAATLGVRGDYVWIIGRDQRFSVATGIGAKRLLGRDIGTEGLPIGRLSVGYAW